MPKFTISIVFLGNLSFPAAQVAVYIFLHPKALLYPMQKMGSPPRNTHSRFRCKKWVLPLEIHIPVSKNGFRPLEMHFPVSKNGFRPLEMYFSVSKNGFRPLEMYFSVSKNGFRPLEMYFSVSKMGFDPSKCTFDPSKCTFPFQKWVSTPRNAPNQETTVKAVRFILR